MKSCAFYMASIPSNLTANLDRMIKVVHALKLDDQTGWFYNLMTKVVLHQKFSGHLDCLLKFL